jgi:hypothetical protein
MSRNEYLFQSRSVCAFLLVCICLSPSVFADGFGLSSGRGFDDSVSINAVANQDTGLSLLTLIQKPSTATQKESSQWNTAQACQVLSNAGYTASNVSSPNSQVITATDITSVFGQPAPVNTLWKLGQHDILWSLLNAPAEKVAAAPRLTDSTT